jgi:hypothetical protein
MFRTVSIQLIFANLASAIENYRHQSNKKRLYETAFTMQTLRLSTKISGNHDAKAYHQALAAYEKAKLDFAISESQADYWKEKAKKLQNRLTRASWQDFAHQAGLHVAKDSKNFDSLIAFQQALQECDLSLLSEETTELLEVYLGLDMKALQRDIGKNPDAIKSALQKFFNLEDSGLATFIVHQKARIKAGLIHSSAA